MALPTKEHSRPELPLVKDAWCIQTVTLTKAAGRLTKLTVMAHTLAWTALPTSAIGSKTSKMEKALRLGPMAPLMKETIGLA